MRSKLLFLLLLMIGLKTYSQEDPNNKDLPLYNLFYLSKYITSDNLSGEQAGQIYSILTNIVSSDTSRIVSLKARPGKNPIAEFLNSKKLKEKQLRDEIIRDLKAGIFNRFVEQKNYKIWEEKFKKLTDEQKEVSKLLEKKITFEKLKKAIEGKDSIQIKQLNNELTLKNEILKLSPTATDSILAIKDRIIEIESKITNSLPQKEEYFQEVIDFAINYIKKTTAYSIKYFDSNSIEHATTEIHLNSIIHSAEQRAATNSFSIPSEADMINALAIFLAKRAQQETAIWFMDQLRKNLNNPLIHDAFPETIKLIESLEDYMTPNFSVAWRYAISSDFVKMPKNLAKSSWVKNVVFGDDVAKAALFETSVVFGYDLNRLIAEKYNYRDIIRHFYTTPSLNYDDASIALEHRSKAQERISQSITILYILTNEFFAVDQYEGKQNFRLLSYEEITTISNDQWIALGQLIELKYGAQFPEGNTFFKETFASLKNKEGLSKWIGNLLIALSQFDKVNKDFQKTLENNNENSGNSFYNVWQITSQIIENIDYNKYLSKTSPADKFEITLLKESLDIYDQFQSKNYTTGIHRTMSLIERIAQNDQPFNYAFLLQKKKISFTRQGFTFEHQKHYYSVATCIQDGDILALKIVETDTEKKVTETDYPIKKYSKIQPLLRFVEKVDHDDNYELIKILHPDFDTDLDRIANQLHLDKYSVIELLRIQHFYDGENLDQDKLTTYFKTFGTLYHGKDLSDDDKKLKIKAKYQNQLFKMTGFFGDVLVAKNEQELANVIDSHALPPTSYKLKRRVRSSIDLNGYVGVQASRLITNGTTSLKQQYTAGITAPVGFSFTWTSKGPKPCNYGFTVDVVDLGNVVNHYLVSSNDQYPKDLHFSEVFSPALSGIYSIGNSPFVAFASIKFLPLKTARSDGDQIINNKTFDATLFSIGIKIDIPLVNLWTKTK